MDSTGAAFSRVPGILLSDALLERVHGTQALACVRRTRDD